MAPVFLESGMRVKGTDRWHHATKLRGTIRGELLKYGPVYSWVYWDYGPLLASGMFTANLERDDEKGEERGHP